MENDYFFKLLTKSVNDNEDNYYPHSHPETLYSLYNSLYKDAREEREKLYKIFGKPKSKYHN